MIRKGARKSPIQRTPKTKEELERELRLNKNRAFVKDIFYPALEEATISVDEASMLLQALISLIMEEAMETLKNTEMSQISGRLVSKLTSDNERVLAIEKLVNAFKGQTLFEARGNIEGMNAVISQMKIDEMQNRTLSSMNVNWDKYLS